MSEPILIWLASWPRWIKARVPHVQRHRDRHLSCWRVYGLRPHFRLCLFDWTRTSFFQGQPDCVRIRLFGLTLYERNHHLSGLPGAR